MELVKSKVRFNEEAHTYSLGEKMLRGITWILREYVKPQKYEGVPDYIMQRAEDKGHAIHSEIEMFVNGFQPTSGSDEYNAFVKNTDGIKFIASEYTVSDNTTFASNIDLVDDKWNLYDIKTTSTLDEELLSWQLSIYSYLFELQNKMACGKLYGIWLRGNVCQIVEVKNLKAEQEQIKTGLIEVMKQYGVKKYEGESVTLTYTAPTTRTTIDSKSLKENEPEIYERFSKTSEVKESLRITIKK